MGRFSRRPAKLGASILFCILGIAYCVAVLLGLAEPLCVTNGCSLYQDFSVAGISLWHVGIITFLAIAALCVTRRVWLAVNLSRLTILADCGLLLVMALTTPCLSCLGVAVCLALVFITLYRASLIYEGYNPPYPRSKLFLAWLLLFAAAVVPCVKELSMPVAWHGPQEASVRLYFSPHCPACMQAIEAAAHSPLPVAYYPEAVDLDELKIIVALEQDLKSGADLAESLRKYRETPPSSLPFNFSTLKAAWVTLRNRAEVMGLGQGSVPLLLINGVPQWGQEHSQPAQDTYTPPALPDYPPEFDSGLNYTPLPDDDGADPGFSLDIDPAQCDETTGEDCL